MGRRRSTVNDRFTTMHISEKAHSIIAARKRGSEPLWRVLERILGSYLENDSAFWEAKYNEQCEITARWLQKHNDLKRQLEERQARLL